MIEKEKKRREIEIERDSFTVIQTDRVIGLLKI